MTNTRSKVDKSIKITIGERHIAVPDGDYDVVVDEIRKGKFSGKRDTLEFIFRVVKGDYKDALVRGFVNAHYANFSEHTKLFNWIKAISDDPLERGDQVDLEIFFNKVLKVRVKATESRLTKNPFGNVKEILGVEREF